MNRRISKFLYTFFAVIGIFSFTGIETGALSLFVRKEPIELLISNQGNSTHLFKFAVERTLIFQFSKKEIFKQLIHIHDYLSKISFSQFSKKEILPQFSLLHAFLFRSLKSSDEGFLIVSI